MSAAVDKSTDEAAKPLRATVFIRPQLGKDRKYLSARDVVSQLDLQILNNWASTSFQQLNAPLLQALASHYYWRHKRDCMVVKFSTGKSTLAVQYISPPVHREDALQQSGFGSRMSTKCFEAAYELRVDESEDRAPFFILCMLGDVVVIKCIGVSTAGTASMTSAIDSRFLERPQLWCVENNAGFNDDCTDLDLVNMTEKQRELVNLYTHSMPLWQHMSRRLLRSTT
jgi:hypothetical protein